MAISSPDVDVAEDESPFYCALNAEQLSQLNFIQDQSLSFCKVAYKQCKFIIPQQIASTLLTCPFNVKASHLRH